MTEQEKNRFAEICDNDSALPPTGIGTYMEKRLHRIFKRFFSENVEKHEVKIGNYYADVLDGDIAVEVQTGSLKLLLPKLGYYLTETDLRVLVVCPLIAENTLIRIDKETGEIIRRRRSSRHEGIYDLIAEMYHIRRLFPNERLELRAMLVKCEEHRYSEKIRYRREGIYDSELFPLGLLDIITVSGIEDLESYLPNAESFTAKEFGEFSKLKGRKVYSCLNLFCHLGHLERQKDGKRYIYRKIK